MHDDEVMDRLLRHAMAADAPQLSPAFDARVMRRVRPRRLTPMGRVVIAVYIVVAAATPRAVRGSCTADNPCRRRSSRRRPRRGARWN